MTSAPFSHPLALAAGIDAGQRFLDVGLAPSGKTFRMPNAAEGIAAIVERLAHMARAMPHWTADTLAAFVRAERAIVTAQVRGWRLDHPWAAWRALFAGEHTEYGQLLVEERFPEIEAFAAQLLKPQQQDPNTAIS